MRSETWVTSQLADWVHSLSCRALPPKVLARTEDCVLDVIGCAIAALDEPGVRAIRAVAERNYRPGSARIWFTVGNLAATGAAFANSAATSMLDLDDGHRSALGHPGAAVIPATLAIAAETGASGPEIIAAIVGGYEVGVRLGAAEKRKSYNTGNWASFGAAAAASRLWGLDPEQTAHALAVSAYHGPRLRDLTESTQMGAHVKESIPWSVMTGMSAADLARSGFTGCLDALDLPDRFSTEDILDGLGENLRIGSVYFKRFSICRWTHAAIEALVLLMDQRGVSADEIEAVEVQAFRETAALNNLNDPPTLESAQYSLPFTLGVAATQGIDSLSPMHAAILHDARAVEFAGKVSVVHSPEMDAYLPARAPARVRMLAKGEWTERLVVDIWGDAGSSTTRQDLRAKFAKLAGEKLRPSAVEAIVSAVDALHERGPGPLAAALAALPSATDKAA